MWALSLWESEFPILQWGVVIGASLIAACTDLAWRRIHNALTFPLLLSGLAFATLCAGAAGLLDSFAACVILAFPYVLLFLFANGGAGDAKLMAAVGAWLGVINGLAALCCVAVAGIVIAVAYAVARRQSRQVLSNVNAMAQNLAVLTVTRSQVRGALAPGSSAQSMLTMPYGLAIFAGVCVSAIGVFLWRA